MLRVIERIQFKHDFIAFSQLRLFSFVVKRFVVVVVSALVRVRACLQRHGSAHLLGKCFPENCCVHLETISIVAWLQGPSAART